MEIGIVSLGILSSGGGNRLVNWGVSIGRCRLATRVTPGRPLAASATLWLMLLPAATISSSYHRVGGHSRDQSRVGTRGRDCPVNIGGRGCGGDHRIFSILNGAHRPRGLAAL